MNVLDFARPQGIFAQAGSGIIPLIAVLCLLSGPALAQVPDSSPAPDSPPAEAANTDQPAEVPAIEKPAPPPSNDILQLKSGKELEGRIKMKSAAHFVLEVYPGVTIDVPSAQVVRVTYGSGGRGAGRGQGTGASDAKRSVIESSHLSTDLSRRLYRSIVENGETVTFTDSPAEQILESMASRSGATIHVDESFRGLPPEDRQWTVEIQAGTTLFDFLNDEFASQFPEAVIEYEYDRIVVRLAGAGNPEEGVSPEDNS